MTMAYNEQVSERQDEAEIEENDGRRGIFGIFRCEIVKVKIYAITYSKTCIEGHGKALSIFFV